MGALSAICFAFFPQAQGFRVEVYAVNLIELLMTQSFDAIVRAVLDLVMRRTKRDDPLMRAR